MRGADGGNGMPGQLGTAAGTITIQLLSPDSTARLPHNVVLPHPVDIYLAVKAMTDIGVGGNHGPQRMTEDWSTKVLRTMVTGIMLHTKGKTSYALSPRLSERLHSANCPEKQRKRGS